MLGRRDPQPSLFLAQNLPHRVPPDSFYGRMASVSEVLFRDDDLQEMYDPNHGRPSLPPSLLSGVMLLQYHDDVSDEEAVQRVMFDWRWQVALNLPTDFPGFDPSSLTYFRRRLLAHQKERYAFDRFLTVAREAGFLPDRVTLLTDTTRIGGAGAVQDTYTLLRKGIRKLLKAMGYGKGQGKGLAPGVQRLVGQYLEQEGKARIDWTDPQQRWEQLQVLFADTDEVLDLALSHSDDTEVRSLGWLLVKILGDDISRDQEGKVQIRQGTAPERILSVTDPEMRHGHKSPHHRFDGFKAAVTSELASELITDIQDISASAGDGQGLMGSIRQVEELGVEVERVVGDGAYSSGANLAACATHSPQPIDLVSPLDRPPDPEVAKSAFQIDIEARVAICPGGHRTTKVVNDQSFGTTTLRFCFPRAVCEGCRLFSRCVRSKTGGRTVTLHPQEPYLQAARKRQQEEEFRRWYRLRSAIERILAQLVRHGLRHTRYRGEGKRHLQHLWQAATYNLGRLWQLCESGERDLKELLTRCGPPLPQGSSA